MSFENFIYDNYEVKDTERDDHIRICCPNCGDDKFHGYVNTRLNLYKCWKCHWSHKMDGEATTAYYFLKEFHGLSNQEIFEVLNYDNTILQEAKNKDVVDIINEYFAKNEGRFVDYEVQKQHEVFLPLTAIPLYNCNDGLVSRIARHYIKSRFPDYNLDYLCKKYNIHYCLGGNYHGYVVFPVTEWKELVWWQGRAFMPPDKEPKYIQATAHSKPVFGIDFLTGKDVIITEGLLDAITLGDNTLCVFGSGLSQKQLKIIRTLELNSATVWFDWDGAGRGGARKLCKELSQYVPHVNVVLEAPSDANSLGVDKAAEVLKNNTYEFDTSAELALRLGRES